MMRNLFRRLALAALFLLPAVALAQMGTPTPVIPGYLTLTPQPNCPLGPCFVANAGGPPLLTGFGTLAVTAASVNASTMTVGPNSPAFPMPAAKLPSGYLSVLNASGSAGLLYVCWFGGTCSAAVGEPIAAGFSSVRNLDGQTVSPTVFAVSTATATFGW